MKSVLIHQCAFADDIAILEQRQEELDEKLRAWNEILKKHGMKMNQNKTKVMAISPRDIQMNVILNGKEIEQVKRYKYLGVIIQDDGEQEAEMSYKITNTNKLYHSMSKCITGKREISKNTKMKVYKAIYRPVLTYGCETWITNEKYKSRVRAVEMKYLRRTYGATRLGKIREALEIKSIEEYIEERQLGWWGHVQRLDKTLQAKAVYEAKMQGKRSRGRPKKTWDDNISTILERRGITKEEAARLAKDKKTWKIFGKG